MKSSRKKRIQRKVGMIIAGLGILLIILCVTVASYIVKNKRQDLFIEKDVKEETVLQYDNALVLSYANNQLSFFYDEEMLQYPISDKLATLPKEELLLEKVADLTVVNGAVSTICVKPIRENDRLLGAGNGEVELEGKGTLSLAKNYKGYRLYGSLENCSLGELAYGYDFADYCYDGTGRICAILQVRESTMQDIRILLMNADYQDILHDEVELSCDVDYYIFFYRDGQLMSIPLPAGQKVTFKTVDGNLMIDTQNLGKERIFVKPAALSGKISLMNVNRNQGVPSYRGYLEIKATNGKMAVVNQVALEDYLLSVVPSEMPSGYPAQALKAQSICARTYAYGNMLQAGYPLYGAHVNDSTAYQVYNNIKEVNSTTQAVKESYGELLMSPVAGIPAETYFYSTSCGVGSDPHVWRGGKEDSLAYIHGKRITRKAMEAATENAAVTADGSSFVMDLENEEIFAAFIKNRDSDAFEANESWYRWNYEVTELSIEKLSEALIKRQKAVPHLILTKEGDTYEKKEISEFTKVLDLYVEKRGVGGVADELIIVTDTATFKVITEYNIRFVLNQGVKVTRGDQKSASVWSILHSAYFVIEKTIAEGQVLGYTIIGGGYGHGVGMSQVAARHMAEEGYTAEQILQFFYEGCTIQQLY